MKVPVFVLLLVFLLVRQADALSQENLKRVTFEQHPGRQISADLVFRDETDRPFPLAKLFGRQPTLVFLGYYRCPMLCTLINDGLISALQELRLNVGRDFQVVDLSIDPTEKAPDAARKKIQYLRRYGRPGAADGWHFLVGDERAIAQLANEVGYRYAYDPEIQQYAHPSGIVVLTPNGRISHYLFGVNFNPRELLNALNAAKEEKSSAAFSQLFLLCYHYNPITGKYGALIMSIMQWSSIAMLIVIAGVIAWLVGRDRRARRLIAIDPCQ